MSDSYANPGDVASLPPVLLDREGNALAPSGVTEINTEVGLQRHFPILAEAIRRPVPPVVVRGRRLARWAQNWCEARGIPYTFLASPSAPVYALFPGASDVVLAELTRRFVTLLPRIAPGPKTAVTLDALPPSRILPALAEDLMPGGPWRESPSSAHAARFLLYLADLTEDSEAAQLLRGAIQELWQRQAENEGISLGVFARMAYNCLDAGNARHQLETALRDSIPPQDNCEIEWPPLVSESWQETARQLWRHRLLDVPAADFIAGIAETNLPDTLRAVAATVVMEYLEAHPQQATADLLWHLAGQIPEARLQRLRGQTPPPLPPLILSDATIRAVLEWFERDYLPCRIWLTDRPEGSEPTLEKAVTASAHSFALWYLNRYPLLLSGAPERRLLAMERARALLAPSDDASHITLWVILDGLPLPDADSLRERLRQREPRLKVVTREIALGTLPTITAFAKPALKKGLPPRMALEANSAITEVTEGNVLAQVPTAAPGAMLLLSLPEPDKMYHFTPGGAVASKREGVLESIAALLAGVTRAVPEDRLFRIIITTDHGRLLTPKVHRISDRPDGTHSEGRAAWRNPYSRADGSAAGYELSETGDIALLYGDRFGLPTDVWVRLDEAAFPESDGGKRAASYAHGGVWPEEVLCPWLELVRDADLPTLRLNVTGAGRAGTEGTIELTVENPGPYTLQLRGLELRLAGSRQPLGETALTETVSAFSRQAVSLSFAPWPEASETFTARLMSRLPNGLEFVTEAPATLMVESLYQRTLSASDLDF